jgi:hypothetical protein
MRSKELRRCAEKRNGCDETLQSAQTDAPSGHKIATSIRELRPARFQKNKSDIETFLSLFAHRPEAT